jgi:hypothetical protein
MHGRTVLNQRQMKTMTMGALQLGALQLGTLQLGTPLVVNMWTTSSRSTALQMRTWMRIGPSL